MKIQCTFICTFIYTDRNSWKRVNRNIVSFSTSVRSADLEVAKIESYPKRLS